MACSRCAHLAVIRPATPKIAAGVDSRDSRNICIELVAKWFHHMRVPILKNTAVKGEQSDGLVFLRLTLAPHWRRMILIERYSPRGKADSLKR